MSFILPVPILQARIPDEDLQAIVTQVDETGVITPKIEFGGIFDSGSFTFTPAAIDTDEDVKPYQTEFNLKKVVTNSTANGTVTNSGALNFRIQARGKVGFFGNRMKIDLGLAEDGTRIVGSSAKLVLDQETQSFTLELTAEAVLAAKPISLVVSSERIEAFTFSELSLWINSTT